MVFVRRACLFLLVLIAGWIAGWISHNHFSPSPLSAHSITRFATTGTTVTPPASPDTTAPADESGSDAIEENDVVAPQDQDLATLLANNDRNGALDLLSALREREDPSWPEQLAVFRDTLSGWLDMEQTQAVLAWTQAFIDRFYFNADIMQLQAAAQMNAQQPLAAIRTLYLQLIRGTDASVNDDILRQIHLIVDDYRRGLKEQRNWKDMQALYQYLVSMEPNNAGYYLQLATALIERGANNEARLALNHVYDDPEHGPAAFTLSKRLDHAAIGEVRIPLQKKPNSHFTLEGLLDGKNNLTLLVDTGASLSAISRDSFERLQTPSRPTFVGDVTVDTANGSVRAPCYRFRNLALAGITLRDVDMLVLDNLPSGQGLLGMNVLGQFPFRIDQENSVLLLNDR